MALSIKKLLAEYFSKEQVQDALRDIGESTSGTKEELVNRLLVNWKSHNQDNYDLLYFLDKTGLQMICYHYNLDPTNSNEDAYIRRIKKANLLEITTRKNSIKNDPEKDINSSINRPMGDKELPQETIHGINEHKISKKLLRWTIVGAIATIIGVITSIIFYLKH
jgi:hypothetical protein